MNDNCSISLWSGALLSTAWRAYQNRQLLSACGFFEGNNNEYFAVRIAIRFPIACLTHNNRAGGAIIILLRTLYFSSCVCDERISLWECWIVLFYCHFVFVFSLFSSLFSLLFIILPSHAYYFHTNGRERRQISGDNRPHRVKTIILSDINPMLLSGLAREIANYCVGSRFFAVINFSLSIFRDLFSDRLFSIQYSCEREYAIIYSLYANSSCVCSRDNH